MAASGGTKAIVAAFFANLGIAIAKFVGFIFTGSSSMPAESIHSVADTGNQGLLLLGGRLAHRKADDRFQIGFGRERYFWSFVVALVLFSVGALFAIYEGVEKIRDPHEPVVLLEDVGALVGLVIALASVTIAVVFDAPVWDGVGTLAIGALLAVIAAILAIEMRSLLLGEAATPDKLAKIKTALLTSPEVTRIIHLRTQHIGPEKLLVGPKVSFEPGLDTRGLAAAIDEAERRVRSEVPMAYPMYIEPALYHPDDEAQ